MKGFVIVVAMLVILATLVVTNACFSRAYCPNGDSLCEGVK